MTQTNPEQWAVELANKVAVEVIVNPSGSVTPAADVIQAAFAEREARLVGALGEARRIITEIDDYMMRPERGDWGTECALCMGELLDDDRDALARIDTALSQAGGASE